MHTIRLREPWQADWVPTEANKPCVHYLRKFHMPTGLEGSQDIDLVFTPKSLGAFSALLNDEPLEFSSEPGQVIAISLTGRLRAFNLLKLVVTPSESEYQQYTQGMRPAPLAGLFEVELQISS